MDGDSQYEVTMAGPIRSLDRLIDSAQALFDAAQRQGFVEVEIDVGENSILRKLQIVEVIKIRVSLPKVTE